MQHLLLLTRQVLALNLLLYLSKSSHSHVHHIDVGVLRTQQQFFITTELFRKRDAHKVQRLHESEGLFGHVHQAWRHESCYSRLKVRYLRIDATPKEQLSKISVACIVRRNC